MISTGSLQFHVVSGLQTNTIKLTHRSEVTFSVTTRLTIVQHITLQQQKRILVTIIRYSNGIIYQISVNVYTNLF